MFNLGLSDTVKWIVIGLLLVTLSGSVIYIRNLIVENERQQVLITKYEENIKHQKETIERQKVLISMNEEANLRLQSQLDAEREKYDNILDGIGGDIDDSAPQSLKELIERLK